MRLTESTRHSLLALNEGFIRSTSYEGKNFWEERDYLIKGGELIIHAVGKGSWSDSRYDRSWVADKDELLRFLRKYLYDLKK